MDNRGPYSVERQVNQVNYVIRRSPTAAPIIVHIDRLSRYYLPKEADGITDKLPPVWKTRSTAQVPRPAAATQPKTDMSDGLNVSVDVCDRSSTTRIPGTAIPSSPPTTAVTVGDTAARDQSTRGQEMCQQEGTMERTAAPAQLLDHETNGTQIQPTCHLSGSDAVNVQAPAERSSQEPSPIPDVEDRRSGGAAASHAGKCRPSLPDHSGMYGSHDDVTGRPKRARHPPPHLADYVHRITCAVISDRDISLEPPVYYAELASQKVTTCLLYTSPSPRD